MHWFLLPKVVMWILSGKHNTVNNKQIYIQLGWNQQIRTRQLNITCSQLIQKCFRHTTYWPLESLKAKKKKKKEEEEEEEEGNLRKKMQWDRAPHHIPPWSKGSGGGASRKPPHRISFCNLRTSNRFMALLLACVLPRLPKSSPPNVNKLINQQ